MAAIMISVAGINCENLSCNKRGVHIWDRKTIELGINELRTGIVCIENFKARGNKKTEVKNPQLEVDIIALAEPNSQTDPKFQPLFKYTRITAKGMRMALITEKSWKHKDLPCEKTIGTILNRLGYCLPAPSAKSKAT